MAHKQRTITDYPSIEILQEELNRLNYRKRFNSILRSTIFTLVVVAAIAVLVASLWMPVLRIYGVSMAPTLSDGSIVITMKDSNFKPGEIVAFYYNNNILVKRVVAQSGDWVNIDEDGVPEGRIFVVGDNRAVSIDSRNKAVGCISEEQIVGKLVFKAWPVSDMGVL